LLQLCPGLGPRQGACNGTTRQVQRRHHWAPRHASPSAPPPAASPQAPPRPPPRAPAPRRGRESAVRDLYKAHIAYILGRTNSVTGQQYARDPTIFGWDVLNEPRWAGARRARPAVQIG
jgi:hypothetical protein